MMTRRDLCRAALAMAATTALIKTGASNATVQSSGAQRITSAQAAMAMRLLGAVAGSQYLKNIVLSPASLAGTLSVIERGGTPRLAANLHQVLGFEPSATAWSDFDTLRRITNLPRNDSPLSSANALFFDAAVSPHQLAMDALAP